MRLFPGPSLPNVKGTNSRSFIGSCRAWDSNSSSWVSWTRPKTASMLYFLTIGGGGGGGAASNVSNNNQSGGGGGGSGGIATLLIAASLLPKVLFLRPGCAGEGGVAYPIAYSGTPSQGWGGTGEVSIVSVAPNIQHSDLHSIVVASGSTEAGGGGNFGSGQAVPNGGVGSVIASAPSFAALGLWSAIGGQSGSAGGFPNAADVTFGAQGLPLSGGAGGGGDSTGTLGSVGSGGSVLGNGLLPDLKGGNYGPTPFRDGSSGLTYNYPFRSMGGAGGRAEITDLNTVLGQGGGAGIGSGGGGSAGSQAGNSPMAGAGGPGLIYVMWW